VVDELLDELDLDGEQVWLAITFNEAYAYRCLNDLESTKPEVGIHDDGSPTSATDNQWLLRCEAATSLRDAGAWALLIDTSRAQDLLRFAGSLFVDASHPYGLFLMAIAGADRDEIATRVTTDIAAVLEPTLLRPDVRDRASGNPAVVGPSPLRHQSQHAYVALAAAYSHQSDHDGPVDQLLTSESHRRSVMPVGALGASVGSVWMMSYDLWQHNAASLLSRVATLAASYSERIRLAMVNEYCWQHAATQFDVVDLELFGVVSLAARRMGQSAMKSAFSSLFDRIESPARSLLIHAMNSVPPEGDETFLLASPR
jgi:hypothetical protein